RVLELAREEVGRRNDRALGSEHLLLAILSEPDASLSCLIEYLGIAPDDLRRRAEQQMGRAQAVPGQPLPLRWQTTRIPDPAYEEARQLRHDSIGAPHLLIALIHEGDSLAAHILEGAGLAANRARAQLHSQPRESSEPGLQQLVQRAREEAERKGQAVV